MLFISPNISIDECFIQWHAIRAQGAGGQKVNKTSCAICLQADLGTAPLSDALKERLHRLQDSRISKDLVVTIKAQRFRTQEQNKQDAIERLTELIKKASYTPKVRKATKPTKGSQKRRLDQKSRRSAIKSQRQKPFRD